MAGNALPLVNWLFWSTLASGTLGVVAITEVLGGTTRGYRLFMAWLVAGLAAVLLLSELALPASDGLRAWLVYLFVGGAAAYLGASILRAPRSLLGAAVSAVGLAATVVLAASTHSSALFPAQLAVGTVVLGSVTAAMLLGHWYLVTPRLSPAPLRRMMWLLLAALVLQAALFATALATVWGGAPSGPLAWLTWLRLGAGTLLPIAITVLAILASRAASLQASTGLLYVGLALTAAGCIAGTSIAYLSGVPV